MTEGPERRVQCRTHGGGADDGAKRDCEAAQVGDGKQTRCDTGHAAGESDGEENGAQLDIVCTPFPSAAAAGAASVERPQADDHQHAGNVNTQHIHGKIARCPWTEQRAHGIGQDRNPQQRPGNVLAPGLGKTRGDGAHRHGGHGGARGQTQGRIGREHGGKEDGQGR